VNRARSSVQVLFGAESLSAFRVERLLRQLRPQAPALQGLREIEVFIVQGEGMPAAELRRLLGPGPERLPAATGTLFVVPRLGTVSPWSSKATDIARVCGLAVQRIERGRAVLLDGARTLPAAALGALHDRMTESVLDDAGALVHVFDAPARRPLRTVDVLPEGRAALERANREWGLALSAQEIGYLAAHFAGVKRNPTDAELMMFAQINSEHCRHKIFNGEFTLDGARQRHSLFEMIKLSHQASPAGVLSAYTDNAAVIEGTPTARFMPGAGGVWQAVTEPAHILMKVETHNHPTGISPHPGAGTGAGGEIRDEAATGRGAKPKAGLTGFTVSHLRIPGFEQPWETSLNGGADSRPERMATPLAIMLEGPIGGAAYNNEFGRPNLAGYFRTFEMKLDGARRGYHKPIMIAGGLGNIRPGHVQKQPVATDAALLVLGGPAMLIGLGGGAASSMATGASTADLDFASVQRANPELQRRCQEVIDWAFAQGEDNPILSIHDVGAGGLSNALPELVHADDRGGLIRLRAIASADPSLSPMEIWCNEAQERYVLAVPPERLPALQEACARERCPIAVVGRATAERILTVEDEVEGRPAVDMPMPVLLGKPPRLQRESHRAPQQFPEFDHRTIDLADAVQRVLRFPAVASKSFLITIGDRTVGGLTVRDQMVGPWQVPVADCAVTASGFAGVSGEAMALGERPPLALLDAPASGRMAVGEAITNIAAARIGRLADVRLSANWMAASGFGDEDARLYDTVRAVGAELCPQLGIAIPVGKDSLSMRSVWSDAGGTATQIAPLSLIVSAFAPVADVRKSLTPQLRTDAGATHLLLIDLGGGRNRLGGSALAQAFDALGATAPDLDVPEALTAAFAAVQELNEQGALLAYHDRSDGGLLATLCEMAFAGHCGVDVVLDELGDDPLAALFSEELGMVLQVRDADLARVRAALHGRHLAVAEIGAPGADDAIRFSYRERVLLEEPRATLQRIWAETSHRIAALRDHPECAREEFETVGDPADSGLTLHLTFEIPPNPPLTKGGERDSPPLKKGAARSAGGFVVTARPRVAVLREQGVNGQVEMAFAFHAAGFESVDVHMTDLLEGRVRLDDFRGIVACGGFSYGDVLGAGQGWAKSILFHARTREMFARFLARDDRFALGVCNGCQMFAALKEIVPGAEHWPVFRRNRSEQFEARWAQVEILDSRSLFFAGMAGSKVPIAVAHGEGRADFARAGDLAALQKNQQVAMRFVDSAGRVAERYPQNPNGSPGGVTAICNDDGRVTILMPHPERTIRGVTGSWWPRPLDEFTPWIQLFRNARKWVG
jgi:phosphoribosylformylglycinamidine synthase